MNKLKILLILLIIVSLFLLGYLLFGMDRIIEYTFEEYRVSIEGENPELEEALKIRIFPINISYLESNYKGEISLNYFYEKLYDFVHINIMKLKNDLINTIDLEEYLKNNQNEISAICGITNIESLIKLKTIILNLNLDDKNYIDCEIIDKTYKENDNYDCFDLKINYINNESILFKIFLSHSFINSPLIIFEPIMEE